MMRDLEAVDPWRCFFIISYVMFLAILLDAIL